MVTVAVWTVSQLSSAPVQDSADPSETGRSVAESDSFSAPADGTVAGTCPANGDCCSSHATPGCDDFLCCDVVCNAMPFCCEGLWSNACAEIARAVCDACETPYVCPQPGDCCTGRFFSTGCERSGCCRTVCALDEFCCIGEWDDVCARKARENCLNVCDCEVFGDFDGNALIDLGDAAQMQNCFSGDGSTLIPLACACADYDGDGDADLSDATHFINAWTTK